MGKAKVAQKAPYPVELEKGKIYLWCSCGESKTQPFCDKSHIGTDFKPVKIQLDETQTKYLCGCKQSSNAPFCDGTHKTLK